MNVLISSAGRRVGLANHFRRSMAELGVTGRIIAIDATPYSPAGQLADAYYLVPRCTEVSFIPEVLEVCERERVNLLVPTIDTELHAYSAAADIFRSAGICVAISAPEVISICRDKILTHRWLMSHGFPTPRQCTPNIALHDRERWHLPLVIKPRDGSASIGFRVITSWEELDVLCSGKEDLVVQEVVDGAEHTVNVFVNSRRRCICAVPHLRMEVRGGEVSKGRTVKDARITTLITAVVEALPGAFGALNVQCFITPNEGIKIIEINARFGGGYPIADHAGAHMTTWLLREAMGTPLTEAVDNWQDGLLMLRYDEAVFLTCKDALSHVSSNTMCNLRR